MIYNIDGLITCPYQVSVGDIIEIYTKIEDTSIEKKIRLQKFQGICIAKKGYGITKTITIRRVDFKGRVERIFPLFSPCIESIVVKYKNKVRRAKLYYIRKLFGKKLKMKKQK